MSWSSAQKKRKKTLKKKKKSEIKDFGIWITLILSLDFEPTEGICLWLWYVKVSGVCFEKIWEVMILLLVFDF